VVIKPQAPIANYSLRSTPLPRRYYVNNFSDYFRFNKHVLTVNIHLQVLCTYWYIYALNNYQPDGYNAIISTSVSTIDVTEVTWASRSDVEPRKRRRRTKPNPIPKHKVTSEEISCYIPVCFGYNGRTTS